MGRRTEGRVKWIRTRKVKQEDVSKNGTELRLRERGVRDECGLILRPVRGSKEFVDREIWWVVRGKEDVGNIM